MNRQRRKNIVLLILSASLLISITLVSNMNPGKSDSLDVDRTKFSIENTIRVNTVIVEHQGVQNSLAFIDGKWLINNMFQADPSKVHLLFATIQQVQIRRPVSQETKTQLGQKIKNEGIIMTFFEDETEVLVLQSIGDTNESTTYFQDEIGNIYLVEIPGYRAYIHGLLSIEDPEWRNHNLYHRLNWRNLASVSVNYSANPLDGFKIIQGEQQFEVEGLIQTDTTRLFDFVDYISLLEADRYLTKGTFENLTTFLEIDIRDVGNRPYIMELFHQKTADSLRIGRMDKEVYFAIPENRIAPLIAKPKDFAN